MYRVCGYGCYGSAIMKAFDDAIADGVDVLSISLGSNDPRIDFSTDPIAIGAFHAMENGIVVACSAGNSGPNPASVENAAPWILTVAATTIDRDFESDVALGGNKVIKAGGINFSNLKKSPVYPLIDGLSAKSNSSRADEDLARFCDPDSLDPDKVKGKILLCERGSMEMFEQLRDQSGAIGMITISDFERQAVSTYKDYPISAVTEEDGAQILSYIKSDSKPVATILSTKVIPNYKPAPVVGIFSSKGPIPGIRNLIKPDIAAPGVNILAAWVEINNEFTIPGKDPSPFVIISGTSMSCPHVSGLAATIKSQHPTWSPAAIRSAIMTTAIQTDNLYSPITNFTGLRATPYDIGAGEISLSSPLEPGLVYETEKMDYIQFLCSAGYNTTTIKMIASNVPENFSCPIDSSFDSISNMNYASIAVSLKENEIKTVSRIVTNVGEDESIYAAIVEAPSGVDVRVVPDTLQFTKDVKKLEFQVVFEMTEGSQEDLFGSITWFNEKYKVRSPIAVSNAGQESR
ncbi:Tripeptidyl-peptidase II [Handroanthus impetiginosus]|uniref:Tripeptidyl-peptidase II n=1 Tax=Handroanthus impetiginosus TaxID=429701 RepID=A0A2G9GFW2_9LAMI|nr:Tripeptidyl-peptidase II [Handroanthus impetiginosus]